MIVCKCAEGDACNLCDAALLYKLKRLVHSARQNTASDTQNMWCRQATIILGEAMSLFRVHGEASVAPLDTKKFVDPAPSFEELGQDVLVVDGDKFIEILETKPASVAEQPTPQHDYLQEILDKCEQYWNEDGICDAEMHAVLENIHAAARALKSGAGR